MTTAFINERNLIIAKEVRIAKETNKTTIASSFNWIRHQKEGEAS